MPTKAWPAEQGVDDYGLHWDGTRRVPLNDGWMAVLQAGAAAAGIAYRGPDGIPRTEPPAEVKARSAGKLAALRAEAKAVCAAIARERAWIDGALAARQSWDLAAWRRRHLDHPVTGRLARGLIWEFRHGNETVVTGIPQDGPASYDRWLLTSAGGVAPLPDDGAARLWHPLSAGPDEVRAWRDLIVGWQLPQPVRQAFREVYTVTTADLDARDCSARLAGHVFRQKQARTLMKGLGWTAVPASAWNDGVARKEFAVAGLRAELCFDPASDDVSASGLYDYVVSGQARFCALDSGAMVPLAEVPPLVFTEAMRDAGLFLAATSIGADPEWLDHGGSRRFGGVYWHRFGFGELSASAEIRREVLQRLLPGLAIADRCTLSDRFLHVAGDVGAYRIHLGSGNVLLSPNDRYLRIVAARHPQAAKVALPFDDDRVLTAILSKAFLLAADATITDPSITRQIREAATGEGPVPQRS
jgi:hypothetical protein